MKTKVLIIALLILSLLGAFRLKAHSQQAQNIPSKHLDNYAYDDLVARDSAELIADETWLTYTKTGAKITSYSESAFKDISLKFGDQFKSIAIRYKSDRHGPYKEYVIYLAQDVADNIKTWAKTNL